MATDDEIIKQAQYYIDNDVTMKEAGSHFGICKKTFQVRMKNLESIAPDVFKLVEQKKQGNLVSGAIKGGQNGKPTIVPRSHSITPQQAITFANYMIEHDISLRELEVVFGVSKSTIFDNFTKEILGEDLYLNVTRILESHRPENKAK